MFRVPNEAPLGSVRTGNACAVEPAQISTLEEQLPFRPIIFVVPLLGALFAGTIPAVTIQLGIAGNA